MGVVSDAKKKTDTKTKVVRSRVLILRIFSLPDGIV
jgi:hypothetical protein